ncbi:MAG TPA: hypothetical protein VK625_08615 [Flavitalea sp.]|nr:hypothetical protein [Flavitalea sp.]
MAKHCIINRLLIFTTFQSLVITGVGQSMSTPYSAYGIGDIDHRNYNINAGIGYTGLALKTSVFTAGNNPASAAGIEKSFIIINLNTAGRIVGYHGDAIDLTNSRNRDFTIKKLSFATKPTSFWATGIGIQQFSNVSYQFMTNKAIEGSDQRFDITYTGDGGLNEYYWNNAFSVGKHLMLGITGSIIAGSNNQTEIISGEGSATIESKRSDYYSGGKLQYGLIYTTNLSKKWQASLGAKYSAKTKLGYERTLSVIENASEIVNDEFLEYKKFSLPQSIGGGIAIANNRGITVTADYTYDDWAGVPVKGTNWQLVSSSRISGGIEIASFKQSPLRSLQRHSVQFGGFLNNSYLMVNNQQIKEWGATAGITRSMRGGLLIGASVEGGVRGTTVAGLIKENYFQFTLSFSYRDFINTKAYKFK